MDLKPETNIQIRQRISLLDPFATLSEPLV